LAVLLIAVELALGAPASAQSSAQPAPTSDLRSAREALLRAETITEELFFDLIRAVGVEQAARGLPTFREDPESSRRPEVIAFRREVYGPLFQDPEAYQYLCTSAVKISEGFNFIPAVAQTLLADAPSTEHLNILYRALLEARQSTSSSRGGGFLRGTLPRQLGRTLRAMRDSDEPEDRALVGQVVTQLRTDAREGEAREVGAVIEALHNAGDTEAALQLLAELLESKSSQDSFEILSACTRLLREAEDAADLRLEAVESAKELALTVLEKEIEPSAFRGMSTEVQGLRSALRFIAQVGAAEELDFLLEIQEDAEAASLLGMDTVQSLRFSLQRARRELAEEQREQLDEAYIDVLYQAGERLFSLSEDPMDAGEYRSFAARRDLRYNAISYLDSQLDSDASLRERLSGDSELLEFLGLLVAAKEQQLEGRSSDALYFGVQEKKETRVVAATLLAKLGAEASELEGGLFAEFLRLVIEEARAPAEVLEDGLLFRERASQALALEVPIRKMPEDRFNLDQAVRGLRALGFEARVLSKVVRIHIGGAPGANEARDAREGSGRRRGDRRRGQ
jgi:hypothetical protein